MARCPATGTGTAAVAFPKGTGRWQDTNKKMLPPVLPALQLCESHILNTLLLRQGGGGDRGRIRKRSKTSKMGRFGNVNIFHQIQKLWRDQ